MFFKNDSPPPPTVVPQTITWDFKVADADLLGWTVVQGVAEFKQTGEGYTYTVDGLGEGILTPSFNQRDYAHENFLMKSPTFILSTEDDTTYFKSTFTGGAGNPNNTDGFANSAAVLAANGGNSSNAGHKGLAFYNVAADAYDYIIYKTSNGAETIEASKADLVAQGVIIDGSTVYELHFFDNHHGGWGWTLLDSVVMNVMVEEEQV